MSDLRLIGPLAYRGKIGCEDVRCTHLGFPGEKAYCYGWHCSYCDEPCGSQGHHCDVGDTLLAESKRAIGETPGEPIER